MRRRYINHMNDIQPSSAFVSRLEHEMNRELRRQSHRHRTVPMMLTAAAAVAVIAIVFFGVIPSRHHTDVVTQPKNTSVVTAAPTDMPTIEPTAEPTITPTDAPTPEPAVTASYPPEDERIEIEMGDRKLYTNHDVIREPGSMLITENNLIGTSGSPLVEIHQGTELNSVVTAPLRPGDAYWPVKNDGSIVQLTDAKGKDIGYAERVQVYDEAINTVKEGWKHTLYEVTPPEVPENPVERVLLPGYIRADNTLLRYGKNADAPAVAVLQKDQSIGLAYRVGNWIYASTEPFCFSDESPVTGWIHVTEVLGASWQMNLNHVELLADSVNLRDKPDGKIIGSLNKDSVIYYSGDTVPGKNGDWHYVSVNWFKGTQNGYISADYAKLYVFPLESKLNMDGVVSATLSYSETSPFGAAEQTVEGEKLNLLLDRLRNARSHFIYGKVCGEGTATLTLTYSDNSEVILPVSGDSCTYVRYGAITYDLKTDAERVERFLNDGGVGSSDILSPIFDQIKLP